MSDEFTIEVKDQDVLSSSLIGMTKVKASSLCINNGVRDWFTVDYKGRSAGQVCLDTKFTPAGGAKAPGATVMPAGIPPVGMGYPVAMAPVPGAVAYQMPA